MVSRPTTRRQAEQVGCPGGRIWAGRPLSLAPWSDSEAASPEPAGPPGADAVGVERRDDLDGVLAEMRQRGRPAAGAVCRGATLSGFGGRCPIWRRLAALQRAITGQGAICPAAPLPRCPAARRRRARFLQEKSGRDGDHHHQQDRPDGTTVHGLRSPDQGTGSKPPGWNGWQRASRRAASQLPLSAPWRVTASSAYWEQEG